jgi:phage terminase large subunit-like protein
MVRSAWTVKPGADENSTNPDDFELWFPERLSFELLQKVKAENEAAGLGHLFVNQYLCRPTSDSDKPRFDIATLQRHTIPAVDVPPGATYLQFWDLAFSTRRISADYTVGLCAAVSGGTVYIVDSVRDHFQPTALASRIVEFAARWNPQRVGIENANGSQFLMPTIISLAEKCRVPVQIEWVNPPRGKDAKQARIYSADGWLGVDKLFFSASLPHLQVLYDELTQAGSATHDDMADTLGYLLSWCGQPTQARVRYIGFEADQPEQIEAPYQPNTVLGYGLVG